MASRIQGITVEFGGDTTKLSSALSGVNKEIKNTQSQLKDVEKLLKLDTLKTAASQANEQLQKGDITQEQYDGLQRELQETEQKLKSPVLEKPPMPVSAGVTALGTAAVKMNSDFDSGMENLTSAGFEVNEIQSVDL